MSWEWRPFCGATPATTALKSMAGLPLIGDLTGQANHLGVTIEADIVKQKQPTNNGGYQALNSGNSSYGKLDTRFILNSAAITPST